jgi:hypothetical protein
MKAIIFAAALALLGLSAQANVIDFAGDICVTAADGSGVAGSCQDNEYISNTYGDVPGVDVILENANNSGLSLHWWLTNYNDLVGNAWVDGGDGNSWGRIHILPLNAGESIRLNGFELGAWSNAQRTSNVRVLDGALGVLIDYGNPLIGVMPGNLASTFSPNVTSANGVVIEWKNSAYNVGIDNIDYDIIGASGVPEPSTYALLGCGLAGLAALRRRR